MIDKTFIRDEEERIERERQSESAQPPAPPYPGPPADPNARSAAPPSGEREPLLQSPRPPERQASEDLPSPVTSPLYDDVQRRTRKRFYPAFVVALLLTGIFMSAIKLIAYVDKQSRQSPSVPSPSSPPDPPQPPPVPSTPPRSERRCTPLHLKTSTSVRFSDEPLIDIDISVLQHFANSTVTFVESPKAQRGWVRFEVKTDLADTGSVNGCIKVREHAGQVQIEAAQSADLPDLHAFVTVSVPPSATLVSLGASGHNLAFSSALNSSDIEYGAAGYGALDVSLAASREVKVYATGHVRVAANVSKVLKVYTESGDVEARVRLVEPPPNLPKVILGGPPPACVDSDSDSSSLISSDLRSAHFPLAPSRPRRPRPLPGSEGEGAGGTKKGEARTRFRLEFMSVQGSVDVKVLEQPPDSALNMAALASSASSSVELPSTYEGLFSLGSPHAFNLTGPLTHTDPSSKRSRPRQILLRGRTKTNLMGQVWWGDADQKGEIDEDRGSALVQGWDGVASLLLR